MQGLISTFPQGALDAALFRASQRCETFCRKRLGMPGTSTLTAPATAGAASISVASTLSLDNLEELAVILEPNTGNQEIVQITPGGVALTTPLVSPYPGTITLETGLQFNHSSGAPVQYCFQEQSFAGSASSGDPWTEALETQTAQLALAHLPAFRAGLTRVCFLKSYPLISVLAIQEAYSFDITYNAIPTNTIVLAPASGIVRFQVGQVVLAESSMIFTYLAGYRSIPDDIKTACVWYLADELAMFLQPIPAYSHTRGRQSTVYMQQGLSAAVKQAETALENYRRLT